MSLQLRKRSPKVRQNKNGDCPKRSITTEYEGCRKPCPKARVRSQDEKACILKSRCKNGDPRDLNSGKCKRKPSTWARAVGIMYDERKQNNQPIKDRDNRLVFPSQNSGATRLQRDMYAHVLDIQDTM